MIDWNPDDTDFECAWCYRSFTTWPELLGHLFRAIHTKASALEALEQYSYWIAKHELS